MQSDFEPCMIIKSGDDDYLENLIHAGIVYTDARIYLLIKRKSASLRMAIALSRANKLYAEHTYVAHNVILP